MRIYKDIIRFTFPLNLPLRDIPMYFPVATCFNTTIPFPNDMISNSAAIIQNNKIISCNANQNANKIITVLK